MLKEKEYNAYKQKRLQIGIDALMMRTKDPKCYVWKIAKMYNVNISYMDKAITAAKRYLDTTDAPTSKFGSFLIDLPEPDFMKNIDTYKHWCEALTNFKIQ